MNAIGLALVWCVLQVTLLGLLASGLYLVVRLWRPSAAVPVVLTGLGIVVVLSLMAVSPWPQWTILGASPSAGKPTIEAMPEVDAVTPEPPDEPAFSLSEGPIAEASGEEPPPVKKQPSAVARLWESIVRQLVAPDAASATAWRWPATVAVVLLAAMLCGLGWFVLGVLAVRGERLRSRTVENQELLELVDVLRAELACRRPVEVRQSEGLVTAATIGWRQPVLLLPAEGSAWTADRAGLSWPTDRSTLQPGLPGLASRPTGAGAALLPSLDALADEPPAFSRSWRPMLPRPTCWADRRVSGDHRRTGVTPGGSAVGLACAFVSTHSNHF